MVIPLADRLRKLEVADKLTTKFHQLLIRDYRR
jgi:hypothetical protein